MAAARATAQSSPDCSTAVLGPYYWQIGDRSAKLAYGAIGAGAPGGTTLMSIASSSKWVYSTYVLQKVGSRPGDIPFLNFTSGYNQMVIPLCSALDTVAGCLGDKDGIVRGTEGSFFYGSGHMQVHAVSQMGLGSFRNSQLTSEVMEALALSNDHRMIYTQPQPAGGLVATASQYAGFLRGLLAGKFRMSGSLGSESVCTNPKTCEKAIAAPVPETESWSYSLGHWVETDPEVGDGAFSSPGALGFYPWIDASKRWYGILARRAPGPEGNQGYLSARCGRQIRKAWITGVPVLGEAR